VIGDRFWSYTVSQRRRELSVRAALGADRGDLFSLVLRDGLVVAVAGLMADLIAASLLAQLAKGVLFGIAPVDPIASAVAPLVLLPIAAAACLIPARRAGGAEPAAVLRGD
jgi:putative ABC transport system permease protein